jgi:partner of Y14 and mago protein
MEVGFIEGFSFLRSLFILPLFMSNYSPMSSNSSTTPVKSIAGIQDKDDARVIPMTRRPDGTYRKERKIRPGYTPPEDVAKYTNRVLDSARPAPGPSPLAPPVSNTPKTKAQLKNDKRKAKRKDEQANGGVMGDAETEAPSVEQKQGPIPITTPSSDATTNTVAASESSVDPEKKLRALNKKLRQAEQLKERQEKGEEMLSEQLEKISKLDELQTQIAELSL